MAEIVCLGEALVDLVPTETGLGLAEAATFVKAAGGAPANVAAGVARLGVASAFVGAVGDDGFGRFLAATLAGAGVDASGLRVTAAAPTALAAVSLAADGDRDFIFYGHPAAHAMLELDEAHEALIRGASILHVGSISLIGGPARAATLRAIDVARRHGALVSYDPNLRLPLWPGVEAAREGLRLGLSLANIVKIGEDEVEFLGAGCDLVEAARSLWHPGLRLMAVTRGAKGCTWLDEAAEGEAPGFAVAAVDATGAGDAFTAALLAALARQPGMIGDAAALACAMRFANAAGALSTLTRGAIPSLPDRAAVERFLVRQEAWAQSAPAGRRPS